MKIKIRSHDARMRHDSDWLQTGDWLTTLRDDNRDTPMGDGHAQPARADYASQEFLAETYRAEAAARAEAVARAEAAARAEATARAEAAARAQAAARAASTERAVIGDELRIPILWCEMGSCISRHADPAALGEADVRARAIKAGWRIDALGRLACPRCQQSDPTFWATDSIMPWDRYTAMARAAAVSSHDPGPARGRPYVGPPKTPWQPPVPPLPRPSSESGPGLVNYPPRAIR